VPRYLADSSIWAWANKPERPDIRAILAERYERGEVLTCAPVILEVMHRARSGEDYEEIYGQLFEALERLPMSDEIAERAVTVQREMAQVSHGNHLRPPHDFLIAAIAEAGPDDVVLWAFDRDLRVIAEHTGQPHEPEETLGPGG
jgi:predicted nucleic acid-binding protein